MKRTAIGYAKAIQWIALNDDTEWLFDDNGSPSVTATLVADIYGRTETEVTADLLAEVQRERTS